MRWPSQSPMASAPPLRSTARPISSDAPPIESGIAMIRSGSELIDGVPSAEGSPSGACTAGSPEHADTASPTNRVALAREFMAVGSRIDALSLRHPLAGHVLQQCHDVVGLEVPDVDQAVLGDAVQHATEGCLALTVGVVDEVAEVRVVADDAV